MIVMRKPRTERLLAVPSADRIRQLAAEVQQSWSPAERVRRANESHFVELLELSVTPRWKRMFDD